MKDGACINLSLDRDRANLLEGFRATGGALRVIRAIAGADGSAATAVVGAYGSGKSHAALAAFSLMAGEAAMRRTLAARLPDMASLADEPPALIVVLHGHCADPVEEIARQAGLYDALTMRAVCDGLTALAKDAGQARIAIVWDEFGAHLDALARSGTTEGLLTLQTLAEWAVRQRAPVATVTTLMHRGTQSYAARADAGHRGTWRKIEGRFATLTMGHDPGDLRRLVADAMSTGGTTPDTALADAVRKQGFLRGEDALPDLLARARPLTPAVLAVLPALCTTLGQNVRTALAFAEGAMDGSEPVGMVALFDHFAPMMRADTGPGAALRPLLLAEEALGACETAAQRSVVKALTLLTFTDGRVTRDRLIASLSLGGEWEAGHVSAALDTLLACRVILDRRRRGDVMLWQGAETDTATLIATEAARPVPDIAAALDRLFPAEAYIATRYAVETGTPRFATARYTTLAALEAGVPGAAGCDALVLLILDAGADAIAARAPALPAHIILAALPDAPVFDGPLREALAIEALRDRADLAKEDPLLPRELAILHDDALAALGTALDPLTDPDRRAVCWIAGGARHDFAAGATVESVLGALFVDRFALTPRILSEQIMRRRVTSVTRSARRRCLLGAIERGGTPSLGYTDATSADASIHRTVYERTGLYAEGDAGWGWQMPEALADPALAAVWGVIRDFFVTSQDAPKPVADLIACLSAPPYGLRAGVLPLLVGAGLMAFGGAGALREHVAGSWRYIDDLTPTVVETLCEEPERLAFAVPGFDAAECQRIRHLATLFAGAEDMREPDPVRAFYDGLLAWREGLPGAALSARGLGPEADALRGVLRRPDIDPLDLLIRIVPRATGKTGVSEEAVAFLDCARRRMEGVVARYSTAACAVTATIFGGDTAGQAAENWVATLPRGLERDPRLDLESRGILARARTATARGDVAFATALSGILFGIGFDAWDERSAAGFEAKLDTTVQKIEDFALREAAESPDYASFVRDRLSATLDRYRVALGDDAFRQQVQHELKAAS